MNILSLDGGGIRGLVPARILQRLEPSCGPFWNDADLMVGTSTGAVLAAGLASGRPPKELVEMYLRNSKSIFADSIWDDIRDLGKVLGADYNAEEKKTVFEHVFGEQTLGELPQQVLLVAYQLDNHGRRKGGGGVPRRSWLRLFDNAPGSPDVQVKVVDALMAATAAPSYWPVYNGHVDGGIRYNHPVMIGITEAIRRHSKLEDTRALSIGTGLNPVYWSAKNDDWGLKQWAPILMEILFNEDSAVDVQAANILGPGYHRIQPILPENIALDDIKRCQELLSIADQHPLVRSISWLQQWRR